MYISLRFCAVFYNMIHESFRENNELLTILSTESHHLDFQREIYHNLLTAGLEPQPNAPNTSVLSMGH
ncbi:hypothetical protein QVD17_19323 [Tagetes erecta]|uniref:Uncharacterized protein n=1 Tax=Tagetes erecta TaxID=13708 RepID=A0AAD8KJD4_TARER|nr:hypothetical protein QVD17_19323 [Tagetes erecta]